MEYLAIPAFVFALAALSQVNMLNKKIDKLENKLKEYDLE